MAFNDPTTCVYVACGIVAVLLTGAWYWFSEKGYVSRLESLYMKYRIFIETGGTWLEKNDPVMYQKVIVCANEVKAACADGQLSAKEVQIIYRRAKDIYDLVMERRKRGV